LDKNDSCTRNQPSKNKQKNKPKEKQQQSEKKERMREDGKESAWMHGWTDA